MTGWKDLLWAMQSFTMCGSVFGRAAWGLKYQGEGGFCCDVGTGLPSVSAVETRPCSVAFALFNPCAAKPVWHWNGFGFDHCNFTVFKSSGLRQDFY